MPKEFLPLESDTPNIEGYRAYTPQPDFRSAVEKIRAIKNTTDILITSYPEITRFYELEANFVLPFSWEVKTEWEHLNKPEYISIKYFYDLLELHKTIMTQSGFLLLDSYSWSKLPDRVTGYIETNLELVWEQWENQDSGVMVFGF